MPELAAIKTSHFECVIWTKNISASQQRLRQTMEIRKQKVPFSEIFFQPAVKLLETNDVITSYVFDETLFFENKQYDIEFVFDTTLKNSFKNNPPQVFHRLNSVEDSFHYSSRSHSLRASINTGNDIGWFRIELQYGVNDRIHTQAIAFEVLPTKIDMASDLNLINRVIDEQYPLWRFSLAEKTQQKFSTVKKPNSRFLLLWLAQFESLREDFEKGLKQIVNSPHNRLVSIESTLKIERLKGKLNPKLELEIKHAQNNGMSNKRFSVKKKQLSINTPENRFIKAIIRISIDKLSTIVKLAKKNQKAPDSQRISNSFFNKLNDWQSSLRYFQRHAMFKEVGGFTGLSRESLVLQQKLGYAKVYRGWQKLKWYLDLLGDESSLSLRNVAELYEVWCFLEIRNILIDLGFDESTNNKALLISQGLELSMKDGFAGAFSFKRQDGVSIRLAHEPVFRSNTKPIKTWTTPQKPDILLEACFPDGSEFIWLFDAKYRIKLDEEQDLVPDDAINQMHRYRDALIHQHKFTVVTTEKTRPVFGAYALYPGFYDQKNNANPYQEAIEEIGIGAFSLLPASDNSGGFWLKEFLKQKLGLLDVQYASAVSEKFFVEEAVRIPYRGTSVTRYSDLTIAVSGMVSGRNKKYRENLEQGKAEYYHMQLFASERQNIEQHIIKEARYLAIAVTVNSSLQKITHLYPIIGIEQKRRAELTEKQTGTNVIKDPDKLYWLFKLGASLKLLSPVEKTFTRWFEVKLTNAIAISKITNWEDLPIKYKMLS